MPENTLSAFLNHGVVRTAFEDSPVQAKKILAALKDEWGIDIHQVCRQLLEEGVAAFSKSFEELIKSIEMKVQHLCPH